MSNNELNNAFGRNSASLEQINRDKLASAGVQIMLFLAHRQISAHVDFITREEAPDVLMIVPDSDHPMMDVAEALKALDSGNKNKTLRLCDSVFVHDEGVVINACPDMIVGYATELAATIVKDQAPAPISP